MQKIPFKVSARTAKLIGQQNFTNPEGATIELVKNAYDADAKNCFIIFDIECESIPETIDFRQYEAIDKNLETKRLYVFENGKYNLKKNLSLANTRELQKHFFKNNTIYLLDNGSGMDETIISNHWMEIGTGNKESDYISNGGRIKTGAKGIGRFALDRLGSKTEMFTTSDFDKNTSGLFWEMDWEQFEDTHLQIDKITSNLSIAEGNLESYLQSEFGGDKMISDQLAKFEFATGTLLKITDLKDSWTTTNIASVFNSLEALVPPKELKIPFKVFCISKQYNKEFGEVQSSFLNDYDTKVTAKFNADTYMVKFDIKRNELDLATIRKDYLHIFDNKPAPYDLQTLEEKKFSFSKSVFEIFKWERDPQNERAIKKIGGFDFTFFFLKNQVSRKEGYPYKPINSKERKALLDKFGGIKIYRDSFRVRPYGENGNDWLKLGERASQSTAGAGQRIGDWRVGANQISGLLTISRIENSDLIDKSDRGALIENDSFQLLRNLLQEIIKEFELDRTKILNPFYLEMKRVEKERLRLEAEKEALRIAELIIEEREAQKALNASKPSSNGVPFENTDEELKSYQQIIKDSLLKTPIKEEEVESENSQVRTLASLGLIVTSFAHELKEIRNTIRRIDRLQTIFTKLAPIDNSDQHSHSDGLDLMRIIKKDAEIMLYWVNYSLSSISKNKRKRTVIKLESYIPTLISDWLRVFDARAIKTEFINNISAPYLFKTFEIDLNTIFSNLISNSIESFHGLKDSRERVISFLLEDIEDKLIVTYTDSGAGLPEVFKNDKESIFLPFTTSKKDIYGADIGTGMGMYLVKNTILDNEGEIFITNVNQGFQVRIEFKITR